MPALFKNLSYTLILALVLLGCQTLQPDKTAVYHTANETLTEENTELNDFFDKMIIEDIKSGEYYMNNKIIQWQNN